MNERNILGENNLAHQLKEAREDAENANRACSELYIAMLDIREATTDPAILEIVDEALGSVRPTNAEGLFDDDDYEV